MENNDVPVDKATEIIADQLAAELVASQTLKGFWTYRMTTTQQMESSGTKRQIHMKRN
jgi:hypothetical protein